MTERNWKAGKTGDYFDAANWNNGVPGSGDSGTIDWGTATVNKSLLGGNLVLRSGPAGPTKLEIAGDFVALPKDLVIETVAPTSPVTISVLPAVHRLVENYGTIHNGLGVLNLNLSASTVNYGLLSVKDGWSDMTTNITASDFANRGTIDADGQHAKLNFFGALSNFGTVLVHNGVRWSPSVGQIGGLAKLGSGSPQAANLSLSPVPAPAA